MKTILCALTLVTSMFLCHGDLTDENTNLGEVVAALKQEIADLKLSEKDHKQEMAKMKQEMSHVKVLEKDQKQEMAKMKKEMSHIKEKDNKQEMAKMKQEMSHIKEHIKTLEDKVVRASSVMFSAYLSTGNYYPAAGEIIPFDQVDLNSGDHFNIMTHTFVCPHTAVYFFTYSLYSSDIGSSNPTYSSGRLVVDGTIVSTVLSHNSDPSYSIRDQSSAGVLTQCSAGAEVRVESHANDNRIYGDSDRHTIFAGFMLASLEP